MYIIGMMFSTNAPIIKAEEEIFDSIILYLDLDMFFAAIEIRENPSLKGIPLIVGGDPHTKRGVVSTCSYEARKYGVHSGMSISKALQLCPQAKIVRPSFELYEKVSDRIMSILRDFYPVVKRLSIDEAYLDLTNIAKDYREAEMIGYEVKDIIYASEQITCSVGIAPTVKIAKIASDYNKPNGLTVVQPHEIKSFLGALDIIKIPGIGKKTAEFFYKEGVYTCGDLAGKRIQWVVNKFGKRAISLWKFVNGYNHEITRKEEKRGKQKSISDEKTFFTSLTSWEEVWYYIKTSVDTIVEKLKGKRFTFRTISLKIRTRDFKTEMKSYSLNSQTNSPNILISVVKGLFLSYKSRLHPEQIRLVGVKVSNLQKISEKQKTLTQFL